MRQHIHILLVEDDAEDHLIIRDMLAEMHSDIHIDWARTYDMALDAIEQQSYDVFLFDYRLGADTGLDLLQEEAVQNSQTPVVLLTGHSDQEIDTSALRAGASDYLSKHGLRASELERSIRHAIERNYTLKELNDRLRELNILRRLDAELSDTLNINRVMELAVDSAQRLGNADICGIVIVDAEEKARFGMTIGVHGADERLRDMAHQKIGIIGRVMRTGRPERIINLLVDPDHLAISDQDDIRAQIAIPLMSQERLIGVLDLRTRRPERFTNEVFDFLQIVAGRISVAIDNARLHRIMRDQLKDLTELYTQVSELEELKTDMIRIASHDLRNPIGVLQGYIEMMRWDLENHNYREFVHHIEGIAQASRRMENITTDILSLEKIEAQLQSSYEPATVDLCEIVHDTYHQNAVNARKKQHKYLLDAPEALTLVKGDEGQLRQAVDNLISNAIKYTPNGGIISIALEFDGDAAIFEVVDNGYGIPEEKQSQLFRPLSRIKTEETSDIEGTGLGLHLVKNIVKRHRGRIIFKSRYGEGSTFGFQLPAMPPE